MTSCRDESIFLSIKREEILRAHLEETLGELIRLRLESERVIKSLPEGCEVTPAVFKRFNRRLEEVSDRVELSSLILDEHFPELLVD